MAEIIHQSFTMEDVCGQFLEDFKKKYKIPKSTVVNHILKYFIKNPNALVEILTGDNNSE